VDETVLCHGRDDTFYLNQLDSKLQGKGNLMKREKLEEAITFEKKIASNDLEKEGIAFLTLTIS
jgi:hypothetical protein